MSTIPAETRAKLRTLRDEFAARTVQRAPSAWAKLALETRCILLMVAGVDPAGDAELSTLALRDWREFTPAEQGAVRVAADALRWQLNGARDLREL